MYSHLFPKEGNPILNNYRLGALEHGLKNFKGGEYLEDNTLTIIVAFYFFVPHFTTFPPGEKKLHT